jgi:hypothetical protein
MCHEKLIDILERNLRRATEPELRAKLTAAIVLLRDLYARSKRESSS